MTKQHLAYSILISVIVAAGCGSNPVKKPKDGSVELDGSSGGTGGFGTGGFGTGGFGTGGSTGGAGGTGGSAVVEPPAQDASPDTNTDATTDALSDAGDGSTDAISDAGDVGVCMPACTVGDKRCVTGGLQTCALVNGCASWGTEVACGANRTCTGTGAAAACTCTAPPAACTAAGNFCSSATVRSTCEMVNGCLALSTVTKTCGARQTCTGNLPSGDCVCAAAPAGCAAAGTFCPTTTSIGTCAQDTDGCFFKSGNDTTCMNGQICVISGATAACACPTTPGTTLGTSCTTVGQTVCSGDTVLTCTLNATSGCMAWTLTNDCAASNAGLTCGTRGGPAACQCPAVTDGTYYVDPVAGSDSGAAPFPTGAKAPAACRFKTLFKATQSAVATGNKIVGITATPPATFTETDTLTLSSGVTLTTDDAALNPANYKINYTGAAGGAAVALQNLSVISGFTVSNANATPNMSNTAVGVSCAAGTVTVNKVTLEGTTPNGTNVMARGLQIGAAPINTCTGTFTNIIASGFVHNVFVSTSAGVAPILTNLQVFNTAAGTTGLLLEAGTVNATTLVIKPLVAATPTGYGVIVRPGSPTVAANYLGVGTSITGTANTGVWLDQVAGMVQPQATLTSALIENGSASGIVVEPTSILNITGTPTSQTQILSADQAGLVVTGGTVVGTELLISNSTGDGVHVIGPTATVTLHKTAIRSSGNRNLFLEDGSVLLDDGSAVTLAMNAGIEFAAGANRSLAVGSATGALVDISNNGGHGVNITGAGTTTSTVTVRNSSIHNNTLNGVNVALTGNGNAITIRDSAVFSNTANGVVVTGAPSGTATNSVLLDTLDVRLHTTAGASTGKGIWLHGDAAASSNITATINACTVHDNRDVGMQIDEDMPDMPAVHTTTTRATLTSNDIHTNNSTVANAVAGGISFPTSSTLTLFTGNKIHNNGKDQVVFGAGPTTGTVWDLDPGSCTSTTAPRNQIYCYTPNNYGLRTTNLLPGNPPDYTVDADHVTWSHTTPSNTAANRDFIAGADTTITVANACTAVTTCP